MKSKYIYSLSTLLLVVFVLVTFAESRSSGVSAKEKGSVSADMGFIKWAEQSVCAEALREAVELDIKNHADGIADIDTVRLLALYSANSGGNYKSYKKGDLEKISKRLQAGETDEDISKNAKLLCYYKEAYSAIFGGAVGDYTESVYNADGKLVSTEEKYGLMLCSPIAKGYGYTHYDDFGSTRSYGYLRKHLGHDLLGAVGTPVCAAEGGVVVACGWNKYGGWRVGIRSFDGMRYWYYAHLRKGHPYNDMYEGKTVEAGEVIGYLGMTGYSTKEDTNNIDTPHLHFGLQIIFDESQKDGANQIWLDMYALTDLLSSSRPGVYSMNGEYYSRLTKAPKSSPD